jgi:hypothetical protein
LAKIVSRRYLHAKVNKGVVAPEKELKYLLFFELTLLVIESQEGEL